MEWKLLTREDYVTTSWSGGTTTQLAIAPEGAVYADRDFLWRLSSAAVELDHSEFTPLPDYDRLLAVLEGEIKLKIDEEAPFPLAPGRVVAFSGGVPVVCGLQPDGPQGNRDRFCHRAAPDGAL